MKGRFISFIALSAALMVGCSKGHDIKGDWTATVAGVSATINFDGAGKFTQKAEVQGQSIDTSGTYALEGENMTMTVTDIKTKDPKVQAFLDAAKSKWSVAHKGPVKWDTEDSITWTSDQGAATFTRKK